MHYFPLRDIQHFILYFFPAFLTVLLIGIGLAFTHFRTKRSEENNDRVYYEYNEGIQDKDGPFPLILILVITGTVIWSFFYILVIGLMGVKI
jgi:hypothetical protein